MDKIQLDSINCDTHKLFSVKLTWISIIYFECVGMSTLENMLLVKQIFCWQILIKQLKKTKKRENEKLKDRKMIKKKLYSIHLM